MFMIILAFATWRISSLLAREDGPFDVFSRIRNFIGVVYYDNENCTPKNVLARGIICVWCNSIWVSAVMALFVEYHAKLHIIVQYIISVLFLSTASIIIDELLLYLGDRNDDSEYTNTS